jgi:hypothetical protein
MVVRTASDNQKRLERMKASNRCGEQTPCRHASVRPDRLQVIYRV